MKFDLGLFALGWMAFAGLASAESTNKVLYTCLTPGVAEGGYLVEVSSGDKGALTASVSQSTKNGPRAIVEYPVKFVEQFEGAEYLDTETGGKKLTLMIDFYQTPFHAYFMAQTNEKVHKGGIRCARGK